jgi:hypothetical protein
MNSWKNRGMRSPHVVLGQVAGEMPDGPPPSPASPTAAAQTRTEGTSEKRPAPSLLDLVNLVTDGTPEEISKVMTERITEIVSQDALKPYTVILLYDEYGSIGPFHANRIYQALLEDDIAKDILLILQSDGGHIEPAYLLSRTCKRLAKSRFLVAIPRRAKSAATLIALGADEIHMGLLSELGPIDPQVGDEKIKYPALALSNALEELAHLSDKYPNSGSMLSDYLSKNLPDLRVLGYLTRVQKSASQYAERLLGEKRLPPLPPEYTSKSHAEHFAQHYEDHGFVIDIEEAMKLLGGDMVKFNTPEYRAANDVYSFLDLMAQLLLFYAKKRSVFAYVGSVSQRPDIRELPPAA